MGVNNNFSSAARAAVLLLSGFVSIAADAGDAGLVYAQALFNSAEPDSCQIVTSPTPFLGDAVSASSLLASASFNDTVWVTGWSRLDVSVPRGLANETLGSYGAGKLEGYLTAKNIGRFTANNWPEWPIPQTLYDFLSTNLAWARKMAASSSSIDPLWYQMSLLLAQLDGQYAGYQAAAKVDSSLPSLDYIQLYQNIVMGDSDVLWPLLGGEDSAKAKKISSSDGHCSLLVKLLKDESGKAVDLLFGHTTWSSFESMDRIWKVYDFPFSTLPSAGQPTVPGQIISFSSYPGMLGFSDDDYYQIAPSMLWVSETTVDNNNATLWKYVTAEGTLLDWARNIIANRLANNASEWAPTFLRYNSGTYNNMMHVLDTKLFKQYLADGGRGDLPEQLLTITEQVPGPFSKTNDVTPLLQQRSYWSSYNRYYDPQLFVLTNQTALVNAYGDHFSYSLTARAQIFAREQSTVVDMPSFQALMRYNAFQTDPVGTQGCTNGARSASNAIAERGDLTPAGDGCIDDIGQQDEGATDVKATSYKMMMENGGKFTSLVISGPTTYNNQPVFCWSTSPFNTNTPHDGLPDCYDFPWVTQDVQLN
jgi:Phospholipase B